MEKKRQPRRIGIADVARRAGVSHATVSRVMNGSFTVDRTIASRVRAAAEELQYHPNPLGRSLALGKSETIGVLVPDLANPMFQAVLRGVSMAAAQDGYRVLIADSSETPSEEHILASDARRRGDGVVLCAPRMSDEELEDLAPGLQPLVLINRTSSGGTPTVSVDYADGIRNLAEHLYALGHRRLAFLSGPENSASNRLRLQGLEQFLTERPDASLQILPGGVSFASGHAAALEVLATSATGVLAFNDLVAMGLLSGLHEQGVTVPGDLSVTGFDDIEFSGYTSPPLTTATVPLNQLGEQAWRRLHALLNPKADAGPGADADPATDIADIAEASGAEGSAVPENTVFATQVQVRGSTGPAPADVRTSQRNPVTR
ncbi:LacI family transcriptional regulator [Arthrobacter sp. UYP6]|uniref:LacI family DNA-binding transcriptional regulator n=1 Tax=Arthrobacter sp. UYP6 TaxID=1756378 RepID=UPI003391DF09